MADKKARLAELEKEIADPNLWQNKSRAQEIIKEYEDLKTALAGDSSFEKGPAIVTVFAGAGGDDAEDFARILVEMYQKYAASAGFDFVLIHQNENDHGGFRNITFEIAGKGAYGELRGESGVHRLVRISPFNAKKLRHTSFALVEVIPKFPPVDDIQIPEEDLEVEFARSSGPGGQNVNKRETSVRVVHKPSGLVAHCESERSQAQNRERAIEILRGKLFKRLQDEREAAEKGLYISKTTEIEWGNQIRSYVFHPYKMIKDHRTGVEERDIDKVLAGDLSAFITAEKTLQ